MAKALELSHDQLRAIRDFCFREGMPFLCTAFESLSLRFLVKDLGVKAVKVASSEVTHHPFLAEIAKSGVGVILSTGASHLSEVASAVSVLKEAGAADIVLMHCVSEYPAEISQINLAAMETMRRAFGLPVGYSDHTMGVEAPLAAAALGAACVEKHFTLDRGMPGPDHRASIDPDGLAAMVRGMRAAFEARGDGVKAPVPCEAANRPLIRKSIVARAPLPAGHVLREADLAFKRPVNGIEPFDLPRVLGRRLIRKLSPDEPLTWDNLAGA
jgi:sialic acid synthase SpsE